VLRGIDEAFDRYDQRPTKTKKINSLAYCSQAVLAAAEDMKEAAVGASTEAQPKSRVAEGFEPEVVAKYLQRNADLLNDVKVNEANGAGTTALFGETAATLRRMAQELIAAPKRLEDVERRLTVLEEKLFAALLTGTSDEEMLTIRAQADRDLAPYRSKMSGPQIEQLHKQYTNKRLLEKYRLPRLSLFYM
jgi:hypothetical protein